MNTLQIMGWYGGALVDSVRQNTGAKILEQAVRQPAKVIKRLGKDIKDDTKRIQKAGVWGGVIGASTALATAPYIVTTVPVLLAARGSNACETTAGAICVGVAGYSAGVFLAVYAAELAIGWSVFEWCAVAARLNEDAERMEARDRRKAARATVASSRN